MLYKLIKFLCLISFIEVIYSEENVKYHLILHKLITNLENIVTYYSNNLNSFNVDGIFGLKVLEGEATNLIYNIDYEHMQIFQVYTDLDKFVGAESSPFARLSNISRIARNLSSIAASKFMMENGAYFGKFKYLITNEWRPFFNMRSLNLESKSQSVTKNDSIFEESISDACLSQILQHIVETDSFFTCNISKICEDIFIKPHYYTSYWTTHQLLYYIIVQKSQCLNQIDTHLQNDGSSVNSFQRDLCSNIFLERKDLLQNVRGKQTVSDDKQDLFLEQTFLCGTIGFMEFLDLEMIQLISSWISESGCFRSNSDSHHIQKKKIQVKRFKNRAFMKRNLLEEQKINDGCLSHKTALGLSALTTHLKLFFLKNIPDIISSSTSSYIDIYKLLYQERIDFQKRFLPTVDNDNNDNDDDNGLIFETPLRYHGNLSLWIPYYIPVKQYNNETNLNITQNNNYNNINNDINDQYDIPENSSTIGYIIKYIPIKTAIFIYIILLLFYFYNKKRTFQRLYSKIF